MTDEVPSRSTRADTYGSARVDQAALTATSHDNRVTVVPTWSPVAMLKITNKITSSGISKPADLHFRARSAGFVGRRDGGIRTHDPLTPSGAHGKCATSRNGEPARQPGAVHYRLMRHNAPQLSSILPVSSRSTCRYPSPALTGATAEPTLHVDLKPAASDPCFYNFYRPIRASRTPACCPHLRTPIDDPDETTALDMRRCDRVGGTVHEYQHAA